jgi:hypothetical protein
MLVGGRAVVRAAGAQAPKFEVDPFWPKPLPNGWVMGQTIGLALDGSDNVWIIHRPGSLELKESYLTRKEADCCSAAPDVLAFDPAGNLIQHWGKSEGHDWPTSNHGITVDSKGNVWLGANGAGQPGPAPGSSAQFAAAAAARGAAPAAPAYPGEAAPGVKTYHDSFILKFSKTGQYLGQIGNANGSKGSMDNDNVRGVAQIRFDPKTNELIAADGYGNHRVSVWDPDTLKFKRAWGAYGKPPTTPRFRHISLVSPRRRNSATRCTALSRPRTAWSTSAIASTIASRSSKPMAPSSRKYFLRRTPGATAPFGRSRCPRTHRRSTSTLLTAQTTGSTSSIANQ